MFVSLREMMKKNLLSTIPITKLDKNLKPRTKMMLTVQISDWMKFNLTKIFFMHKECRFLENEGITLLIFIRGTIAMAEKVINILVKY